MILSNAWFDFWHFVHAAPAGLFFIKKFCLGHDRVNLWLQIHGRENGFTLIHQKRFWISSMSKMMWNWQFGICLFALSCTFNGMTTSEHLFKWFMLGNFSHSFCSTKWAVNASLKRWTIKMLTCFRQFAFRKGSLSMWSSLANKNCHLKEWIMQNAFT